MSPHQSPNASDEPMSVKDLNHSASRLDAESDTPATSDSQTKQSRFNLTIAGVGLIIILLLLLFITAFFDAPDTWYVYLLAGLITGFTLGTVFGIWIGKSMGNQPNLQKFSFATGIVVLNACVGFFGYAYLTSTKELPSIWPNEKNLFYSIGTASTLVSATILCLVNFFWHSRDQQRINTR